MEDAITLKFVTFAGLKKRLEGMFGKDAAALMLFEAGKECGKRSAIRTSKVTGKKGEDLLKEMGELKKSENWCIVNFNDLDLKQRKGTVFVNNSFEALGYGSSAEPVCHFLRGYLSGVLSQICGADMVLIEGKCLAKGDRYCEFHVGD
jgi:predicted hydrocarbon binding protein